MATVKRGPLTSSKYTSAFPAAPCTGGKGGSLRWLKSPVTVTRPAQVMQLSSAAKIVAAERNKAAGSRQPTRANGGTIKHVFILGEI